MSKTKNFSKDPLIMLKMAHIILEENNNSIDGTKLIEKMEERLAFITSEMNSDEGKSIDVDYCMLCRKKLEDKQRITHIIHHIIYHKSYYLQQRDIVH